MSVTCPLCNSKFEYSAYLQTKHWKEKRLLKLSQADNRCQICNSPDNLQVHHRVYHDLFNENDNDLIVLCISCHQLFHQHNKSESSKPKDKIALEKKSFPRGSHSPEGTFGIPWFDALPVLKIKEKEFWDYFVNTFIQEDNSGLEYYLSYFRFLGFNNTEVAIIETDTNSAFDYFVYNGNEKTLDDLFYNYCKKKIKLTFNSSTALQVIK